MIIEYDELKSYAVSLISVFQEYSNLPETVDADDLYKIVINHASKAADEHNNGSLYLDGDCYYMDVKIQSISMCSEICRMLQLDITDDDITEFILQLLFKVTTPAYDYSEKHKCMRRFMVDEIFFPESEIMYSLVALIFIIFVQYLSRIVINKDKFDCEVLSVFFEQSRMLEYSALYIFLDASVTHYREKMIEQLS